MAEFRKWTLHFDDGNNTVDGKRVQDPPGFTAGGGKELVLTWVAAAVINVDAVRDKTAKAALLLHR